MTQRPSWNDEERMRKKLEQKVAQLQAALKNLINHLPESEIELAREVWGNTNTRLILEYREEARQKLAATKDERS
jgi:hypothetical protein